MEIRHGFHPLAAKEGRQHRPLDFAFRENGIHDDFGRPRRHGVKRGPVGQPGNLEYEKEKKKAMGE